MLVRLASGSHINRTSMLRWIEVPATYFSGHSYANVMMPMTKLIVCNIGTGLTAPSKFFVSQSKKNFGQKKPSSAAAIWSANLSSVCRSPNAYV